MKQSFTQEDLGMDRLEVMYALTERSNGAFKPYMAEIGSQGALIVDDKQLSPVKLVHLPDGDWLEMLYRFKSGCWYF